MKTYIYPHSPEFTLQKDICKKPLSIPQSSYMKLNSVISFIKEAIPLSYIFCANLSDSRTDLILVTDRYVYKPMNDISSVLDLALLGYRHINCTVYTYGTLYDHLLKGHLYFSAVCRPENCIYQRSGSFDLPLLDPEQSEELIQSSSSSFQQHLHKAFTFYQGACHYYNDNETNIAAFMLQQTCELAYRSLLLAFRGKEIRCHELVLLRKHVLHFIPEMNGIFDPEEKKETIILSHIQDAYIRSRYDNNYEVNTENLHIWLEGASQLLQRSHQVFRMYCDHIKAIPPTSAIQSWLNDETIS